MVVKHGDLPGFNFFFFFKHIIAFKQIQVSRCFFGGGIFSWKKQGCDFPLATCFSLQGREFTTNWLSNMHHAYHSIGSTAQAVYSSDLRPRRTSGQVQKAHLHCRIHASFDGRPQPHAASAGPVPP